MTYIPEPLRRQVTGRANRQCEYCRLHEENSFYAHEIDHIYAEKHGGTTTAGNLCLACFYCNRHKGSNLCSLDPTSGNVVSLFHPRRHTWNDHFRLDRTSGLIEALTAHGRVTERVLRFNQYDLVVDRLRLIRLGDYQDTPPELE